MHGLSMSLLKWSGRPCWGYLPARSAAVTNAVLSGRRRSFLFVFAPLCGGALVLVHALGLAFVPVSVEDHSNRFLAEGVVSGDVEQVAGGMGL